MGREVYRLRQLLEDYPAQPPSPNTLFHYALLRGDAQGLRDVAALPPLPSDEIAFLAPTWELGRLASLYASVMSGAPTARRQYDELSERAAAEAAQLQPILSSEPRESEGPGDRERVATAWLFFHLERIRALIARPDGGPRRYRHIEAALPLIFRSCQREMWPFFDYLREGRDPCGIGLSAVFPPNQYAYLCSLADVIVMPRAGKEWAR
jgi:hypothetical protein